MVANTSNTSEDPVTCKEKGNEAFKNGDWVSSIEYYTKAIKLSESDSKDLHVYYKNRAAAYLKQEKYTHALSDCNKALEFVSTDPKTLFRRCQALEKLERYEESYRDARHVLNVDPTNKAIQPVLERLHRIVQERSRKNAQTSTKVEQMFKLAFEFEHDMEKRENAMQNILVLARESAGVEVMFKEGVVPRIGRLLKVEKNQKIIIASIRILGELCKGSVERTTSVIKELGLPWFLNVLSSEKEEQVNAVQYCMQTILNAYSGMDNKPDTKPVKELCEKYQNEINTLLSSLIKSVTNRTITGKQL